MPAKAHRKGDRSLQAAMEYLMTYGWAILVIAIVLGVLYYFGVFTGPSLGNSCIATGGYLCSSPQLNSSGYLSVNLAVDGSSPITLTGVNCTSNSTQPANFEPVASTELQNGNVAYVTMKCYGGAPGPIGHKFAGYVWIAYSTATQNSLYQKIAIVELSVSSVNPLPQSALLTSTIPGYTYNAVSGTTLNPLTANVPSNAINYFCSGTVNYNPPSAQSWTVTAATGGESTGYQTSGGVCSITQSNSCLPSNCWSTVGAIGLNSAFVTRTSGTHTGTPYTFNYIVGDTSQQTFIVFSAVDAYTSVTPPSGCTVLQNLVVDSSTFQTFLAECQGQSPGTYSITATGISASTMAYAVYSDD